MINAVRIAVVIGIVAGALAVPATALAVGPVDDQIKGAEPEEPTILQQVLGLGKEDGPGGPLQIILILTLASLLPGLVMTCSCFVRFHIVFSFMKTGLATQGAPPAQVLTGMALFMTAFVMAPVASDMYNVAGKPYLAGEMDATTAMEVGTPPLRRFMLERTRPQDLALFYEVSALAQPTSPDEVPMRIAIPAYVLSELGTAFRMGIVILLPFLVIEIVVATLLSALGMVMLPPPIIAMPVKLLIFVIVDGWHLVVSSLLRGAM